MNSTLDGERHEEHASNPKNVEDKEGFTKDPIRAISQHCGEF